MVRRSTASRGGCRYPLRRRGRLAAFVAAAGAASAIGATHASSLDWHRDPATGQWRRRVDHRTDPAGWLPPRGIRRFGPAPEGPVTASWVSAVSGNWTDGALWSTNPFAPNNGSPAGTTYNAVIAAGPGTYAVTLDSSVGLNALTLGASGATLSHTAGTLSITDKFDLTAGIYSLNGGTLSGGTLNGLGGQIRATTGGVNTLDDVTIGGTLNFSGVQGHLRVLGNLDFAPGGVLRINSGDPNKVVSLAGDQSVNAGTVFFNSNGQHARLAVEDGGTLTVSPGAILRGGWGDIGADVPGSPGTNAVINQGTITADLAGQSLRVVADSFTNTGLAQAINGGTLAINAASWLNSATISANASTLTFGGDWTNAGVVNATGSTVNLGGTFALADLGTFNRTGGTVNITGTLDNTGLTLPLNASTGTWHLNGGTILGGTVTQSGGAVLRLTSNNGNTLDGVTIAGDLLADDPNARATILNGLSVGGSARLGQASFLTFDGTQTFHSGTIRFEGSNSSLGVVDGTLTLAPGTLVVNESLFQIGANFGADGLINQGTIRASGAGNSLILQPDTLANQGVIEALSGAHVRVGYNLSGSASAWLNTGTLRVNSGILTLGGVLDATSGLGTLQRTGGTIGLVGILNNTGSVLNLDASTGSWEMIGGTIQGGTLNLTQGAGLLFNSIPGVSSERMGRLHAVTLNGSIQLSQQPQSAQSLLTIRDGLNLNGTISLTGQNNNLVFFGSQTLTGGTIALDATATSQTPFVGLSTGGDPSATITFSPTTTIRGGNASIGNWFPSSNETVTLVNQGRISADIELVGLTIHPHVFQNTGTLEAINSGILSIVPATSWTNNGLLRVIGGTLNLGAPTTLSSFTLGPGTTFERQGGQVNIMGHMNNTGQNLTLNASTGSWRLTGGSITGGQVTLADGAQLVPAQAGGSSFGGSLRGLTLNGTLNQAGGLTLRDGFTLNGTMILNGTLNVGENGFSQTITGGTFRFDETIGSTISMLVPPNGVQTFAPGTIIRGPGRIGYPFGVGPQYTTAGVINQGLISSDISGRELRLQMGWLENEGTIEAVNSGRLVIDYDTTWANTGLIRAASGGEITLSGKVNTEEIGDLRNEGGSVFIRGPINNTDAHLTLNAQTGSWDLVHDGSIKGGQVSQLDGARLTIGGGCYLDGVTFNQDLWFGSWFGAPGAATIRNGLVVDGTVHMTFPGNVMTFEGNQTFDNGTIAFETTTGTDTTVRAVGGGTLTLGPDAVARGGRATLFTSATGSPGSLVNEGRISADVAGQKISIHTARFENFGTVEAINGGQIVLIPPPPFTAVPPPQFINEGTLRVGAGSATSIAGEYIQGHFARLEFALAGTDPFTQVGRVSVEGLASLDGVLGITLAGGFSPAHGNVFQLFDWSQATLEGAFQALDLPELAPDLWWDVSGLYEVGVVAVVPSPGAAALLAVAGALLAARRRNRRTRTTAWETRP